MAHLDNSGVSYLWSKIKSLVEKEKASAISTAASDATTKANNAFTNAKNYATNHVTNQVGTLSSLTTGKKTNIVAAINELAEKIGIGDGSKIYSPDSLWNGWKSNACDISVDKKTAVVTLTMVLDGTNATSGEVINFDNISLYSAISNKKPPLPRGNLPITYYNVTDKRFEAINPYYLASTGIYYLTLTKGKLYSVSTSYISNTRV